MRTLAIVLASTVIVGCQRSSPGEQASAVDPRPNILLLVADDLGFSDLGSYGGDIHTPNIDRLASQGLIFSQFHTSPLCAPTRSMLLTGNNNHIAGMGIQGGGHGTPFEGLPGFEGHLSNRVVPMPQLLRDVGYHTYTAGKWHLGVEQENNPANKGFERSFNLLQGASNHYNAIRLFETDSVSLYSEDGRRVQYPEGRYSTELYTDKLMEFIGHETDGKPFFAFAAYTSPHWPLQAPDDFRDKYRGRYDMGYDRLREMRFETLKTSGIIPAAAQLPPRLDSITPWADLTEEQQRKESRKMELYAAMVENLDYHVGRLLRFLQDRGLYDNTMIVFMADNGAAAEDFFNDRARGGFLRRTYDNDYDNMGTPTSFVSYGPQWAQAGAAPFNRYKGYTTEGGITAPMILSGKNVPTGGEVRDVYLTVMDLAPTFLEIAGAEYPGEYASRAIRPMLGESLMPYLSGARARVHDEDYVTGLELSGRAFLRKGTWKIVSIMRPFREENFALYDLATDLGETRDVSAEHPEKYRELLQDWAGFREQTGIRVPEDDR